MEWCQRHIFREGDYLKQIKRKRQHSDSTHKEQVELLRKAEEAKETLATAEVVKAVQAEKEAKAKAKEKP